MDYIKFLFVVVSPANAALIVILNMMEIFFIWSMKVTKKSKSTVLIVNLSIADAFLGLTICTAKVIDAYGFQQDHLMNDISKFLKSSLIQCSLLVSILTNLVLTSERLLLVKSPIRFKQITRRHRVYICLVMWLVVFLVTVGFYFTSYSFEKQFIIISSMVFVSLPWPIVCFVLIKRTIKHGLSKKYQTSRTTGNQRNTNEEKFLSLCYRTFIVFTFCWIPYSIFGYTVFFAGVIDPLETGYKYWTAIQYTVHVIAFINSTLNPIIYLFTYDFLKKICSRKPKEANRSVAEQVPSSTTIESRITAQQKETEFN